MTNTFADVVVVRFPFAEQNQVKARPAIIISSSTFNQARNDVVVVAVTSQIQTRLDFEPLIEDWKSAGLFKQSAIKSAITTIRSDEIIQTIGRLSASDQQQLFILLKTIFVLELPSLTE
ncbi:MAG: type II toxin-antitoxin system PemK/MazF family toxin [Herpetosiphon sp.]|nr:type II toxin-antitoxin system PemK/MazF family toxin [Herpetosiphon sp.]